MGIPIIDEILSSFRWLIDFFMNKIPTPLKFVVFLLSLIVFSALFSVVLHFIGIHCDSEGDVKKTPMTSLFTNYNIMVAGGSNYNTTAFFPEEKKAGINLDVVNTLGRADCLYEVCLADGKTIEDGEFLFYPNPNCVSEPFFLFDKGGGDFLGENIGCSNCEDSLKKLKIGSRNVFAENTYNNYYGFCYSDTYKDDEYNWWQDIHCRDWWSCNVPENYYWDSETGLFTCMNEDVCGVNATTKTGKLNNLDFLLLQAGAKPFYEGVSDKRSYDRFLGISCDSNYNPNLTIAGIKIFDYKIWIMIMVVYIMIMGLIFLKPHK